MVFNEDGQAEEILRSGMSCEVNFINENDEVLSHRFKIGRDSYLPIDLLRYRISFTPPHKSGINANFIREAIRNDPKFPAIYELLAHTGRDKKFGGRFTLVTIAESDDFAKQIPNNITVGTTGVEESFFNIRLSHFYGQECELCGRYGHRATEKTRQQCENETRRLKRLDASLANARQSNALNSG